MIAGTWLIPVLSSVIYFQVDGLILIIASMTVLIMGVVVVVGEIVGEIVGNVTSLQ